MHSNGRQWTAETRRERDVELAAEGLRRAGRAQPVAPALAQAELSIATLAGNAPIAQESDASVAAPVVAEHRIMASAAVITAGSLTSSLLGMVRIESVNAFFYGGASGAFTTALRPVQQISDLVVAGAVTGR